MAVFTPVSPEDARGFLERYELGALHRLVPVAEGVENTTYRLVCDAGAFALTLFEKRTPEGALPFILPLMTHAAGKGVPVPEPARDREGRLFSALNGRQATLVSWMPGRWLAEPAARATETAARTLAELHLACADFDERRGNALGPAGWEALIARCGGRASGTDAVMLATLEAEAETLAGAWPGGLPTGPIHADFFPNNVLFDRARVSGVIDWCFACTDALAYDLAIAMTAWGFRSDGSAEPERLPALQRGYEAVRPLGADEREALPWLCRGAIVRFTLTRLHDRLFHDPAWAVTPKDPLPYFRRLSHFTGVAAFA